MASSRYDLNCWLDIKNSNNHKIYANPKVKKPFQTIAAVLNPEIFKLIKKAAEKISGELHVMCYIRSLILSIVLRVMGWG